MQNALPASRGGQLPLTQRCRTAISARSCSHRMAPVSSSLHASGISLSSLSSSQYSRPILQQGSGRVVTARRRSDMTTCSAAAANAGSIPLPSDTRGGNKFAASVRGLFFYLWTLTLSLPLFVTMLVMAPFVMLLDKVRRLWQHKVNNIWAVASTTPWYRVQMEGLENLPAEDEPAVYVANHQSFLDIFSLFHLRRPFKFVSKTSNFFIPIVGWSMFLTGHVMINRVDNRSMMRCLLHCSDLLKQGASVLFFPEGTRSKDGRMAAFKKGAFSVAAKAGVPMVPITLIGTGALMPNGQEGCLYPGNGVRIIVHPKVTGTSADQISADVRRAIASRLPPELVA